MKTEEEDDEDWGVDIDETAVAERMKEQTEAIQRLTMNDDLEKTANERMNLFYEFLKVSKVIPTQTLVSLLTLITHLADSVDALG